MCPTPLDRSRFIVDMTNSQDLRKVHVISDCICITHHSYHLDSQLPIYVKALGILIRGNYVQREAVRLKGWYFVGFSMILVILFH